MYTYDLSIKYTLQSLVLFLEDSSKECIAPLISVSHCTFNGQQHPNDISMEPLDRVIDFYNRYVTHMESFANPFSMNAFKSVGKKPKMRSIAPRSNLIVALVRPVSCDACLRK